MSKRTLNTIRMAADGASAEVLIYDEIGESWFSDGVTAKGFAESLARLGDVSDINVRINSPGGKVFEGMAIYNTLKNHKATVNVHIDGLAASIATVIAMAGDNIHMAKNALFMIHDPAAVAIGTARDMLETASMLEAVENTIVDVYADRTGMEDAAIRSAMNAETWYSADDAKAAGFVQNVTPNKQVAASFDVSKFTNAPEWAQKTLTNLAVTNRKEQEMPADTKPEEVVNVVDAVDTVDADEIRNAAKREERERVTKINALCERAGRSDLAAKYCENGTSVVDVQAALLDVLCASNAPVGDGGDDDAFEKPDDGNGKYRDEYKAEPAYAKAMTEDEYVAMRRVDDGLENVAPQLAVQ